MLLEQPPDPFGERSAMLTRSPMQLLGGRFRFESNSARLLRLVDIAYAGLPPHRVPAGIRDFRVKLLLTSSLPGTAIDSAQMFSQSSLPPPIAMLQGAGFLGGATTASNFVVLSPLERSALVVVSSQMLRSPYHTRYEMIEFAVFTLAARAQQLIPLHGACVGCNGRGVLLFGDSGAGKSTVALHCLLDGLDFLSEDSVFVTADTLQATGIANFLHIRAPALRWLGKSREACRIRQSPVIRRRSGVKKFELDLRREPFRLARPPLEIVGTLFLCARGAGSQPLLKPISRSELRSNLASTQGYGSNQPRWNLFSKNLACLPAFELRRGRRPAEAVEAIRAVLELGEME